MTNKKKPFVNWVLHGIELPLHQNLICWLSPTATLEQSLRAIWVADSQAAVLILPQIKLNSQLSSSTSFFSRHEYGTFVTVNKAIFSSVAQSCPTLCDPMNHGTPGSLSTTNSRSLLKLMSIEWVMPSSHLILCHPLLLPPIPPSIRVFSNESALRMRWPNYWSFSFSISPSNEHPGLISFRMDWLDPVAVQGTLKSRLQRLSSKA